MNVLMVRYELECSLTHYHSRSNKKLYRIRISKKSMDTLRNVVFLYMGPLVLALAKPSQAMHVL